MTAEQFEYIHCRVPLGAEGGFARQVIDGYRELQAERDALAYQVVDLREALERIISEPYCDCESCCAARDLLAKTPGPSVARVAAGMALADAVLGHSRGACNRVPFGCEQPLVAYRAAKEAANA